MVASGKDQAAVEVALCHHLVKSTLSNLHEWSEMEVFCVKS